MDNKALLTGAIVVLILVVGAIVLARGRNNNATVTATPSAAVVDMEDTDQTNSTSDATPSTSSVTSASPSSDSGSTASTAKEFTVNASNYKFSPSTLTVNKGDAVKITVKSTGGTHDLVIDEFDVATKELNNGQEETIEFVADQSGTFEFYCSISNHRQMGMVGTLTVK